GRRYVCRPARGRWRYRAVPLDRLPRLSLRPLVTASLAGVEMLADKMSDRRGRGWRRSGRNRWLNVIAARRPGCDTPGPRKETPMRIAILLYDGMTALDAIGPYDVLRQLPGAEVVFVGDTAGVKRTEEQPLGLVADRTLA